MSSEDSTSPTQAISPDAIESVEFRVFNRVAATKPLQHVRALLEFTEETPKRLFADGDGDGDGDGDTYLHIVSAFARELFGIRIGLHVDTEDHVFIVDAAVEYTLAREITYEGPEFESFLRRVAAPRAAIATWTLIEEIARSVGAEPPSADMMAPIPMIAKAVMSQHERHAKATSEDASTT
ncbi:hypothetical protein [Mycobacterium marinum]|uniref:hypothetical protein n=1 Tax=Mycobacterium marinum TaxID=1781 RepID=UPI003569C027